MDGSTRGVESRGMNEYENGCVLHTLMKRGEYFWEQEQNNSMVKSKKALYDCLHAHKHSFILLLHLVMLK